MASVEELLLELECLQDVFHLLLLEEDSVSQFTTQLSRLVDTTIMTLKDITSKGSLEHLAAINNGDMT